MSKILDDLKRLHREATPPPWHARHSDYDDLDIVAFDAVRPVLLRFDWDDSGESYDDHLTEAEREAGIAGAKDIARMFTRHLFQEGAIDAVAIPDMRRDAELVVTLRNALPRILAVVEAAEAFVGTFGNSKHDCPGCFMHAGKHSDRCTYAALVAALGEDE